MVDHREFPKKPIAQAALSCGLPVGAFVAWDKVVQGQELTPEDGKWIKSQMKDLARVEKLRK
jgi:hypothetical protein